MLGRDGWSRLKDMLKIDLPGPEKGPPRPPKAPPRPRPPGPGTRSWPDLSGLGRKKRR